jgi:serine protease AprX
MTALRGMGPVDQRVRGRHVRRRGPVVAGVLVAGVALVAAGSLVRGAGGASAAKGQVLGYDPENRGSLSSLSRIVGAQDAWALGYTGAGVDVAVIDTGVAPVPGLDASGKLVTGPDLSFDAAGPAEPGLDAFGHGTFMAGVIAARDAGVPASGTGCATCLNGSGLSDTTRHVGIAPDARIVNVKVGAADGAVDVTQVIAAIDWVVQHARDPGLNIRVISLSYGTDSAQAYGADPLAQAAEQAWKHGIVVVAAAGNDGKTVKRLAAPAYDPFVIAAGAVNPKGTVSAADDVVPGFGQHGNAKRPVDVVAPAMHVIGLRVPGSFVDSLPENTGQVGTRFQRGSGTSQSAAIVAGVAALVLQKYPAATPDQVKALLKSTATPLLTPEAMAAGQKVHWGSGLVNAGKAVTTPLGTVAATAQTATASKGTGTLDQTRNGVYVTDGTVTLTGERDVFGKAFAAKKMAAAQTEGTAWTGGVWNGSRWTGDGWQGSRWTSVAWTGKDWAGHRWSGHRWSGMTWDGHRWSGSGWDGSRWTGAGWDGDRWATATLD